MRQRLTLGPSPGPLEHLPFRFERWPDGRVLVTNMVGEHIFLSGDELSLNGALSGSIGGITFGYNAASGVMTMSGSDTVADYQAALRLVALGYTHVYWYRGGREAWEVAALPETNLDVQAW